MNPVVRLTASATRALPRAALLAICLIYAATGLFARDPWKNEDAAGFGAMYTLAHGTPADWLTPNIFGHPVPDNGPLMYWLGALSIRLTGWLLGASNAARLPTLLLFLLTCGLVWYGSYLLGRRAEVQPFKYAFGGEPAPRDYGRTIADGAVLILLACFGLAERGHESTAQIAQLLSVTLVLYGLARLSDKPWQGAACWGGGVGLLALSGNPVMPVAVGVCTLAVPLLSPALRRVQLLVLGLPLALAIGLSWPLVAWFAAPDTAAHRYLYDWLNAGLNRYSGGPSNVLAYAAKNFPLFTWPAWPLALWSLWSWRRLWRAPHVAAPLAVAVPLLLLVLLQSHQNNRLFVLPLPALSMLAAFGLPTLKRGAINAIDWFAVLSFTLLSGFVWIVWIAGQTGFPPPIARNLARLLPGFQPSFNPLALAAALAATAAWVWLVRWRLSRSPKVLWRSVVLSSAGTTLMWVLLMTLWLPFIDYSRTYRDVAQQIASHLPPDYTCIDPVRLGEAQIASFGYFADMRFRRPGQSDCNVLLRQDRQDFGDPQSPAPYCWRQVWEGRRAADRDERFRLYLREARPARAGAGGCR
ncbi:ArnT family glycosyltransferase [Chitinasiproducens palmae]|nr:UDP phosphate-alpha-4-amino-4-deoxy-L-arabinose arabinosyl transferase [Chitinasiproducens palmae]